ncbi:hydantoinase/oxoprolinase N-terminal domain-containing protein [Cystobacter ferrugineus]|uniref:Hydantoinase subunit beta n=1 Tax=Cystobacter ferrugineus TaxID=83449 RepID=A0A1L9BCH9_9BACT|nr:hydantoinase/oxoprolinase family protein [Cystobacter ferrugineus]OJH39946.1 hydantoinase subunit beta [Cystobacter ferrugineus]
MRRVGIDVGGTHTDAVLMQEGKLLAWSKVVTTPEVLEGIRTALRQVARQAGGGQVGLIAIGTTQLINALVERRRLAKVAAVRLGLPSTRSLPPFVDWPEDLLECVRLRVDMVEGGHEFDGREISPLDEAALRRLGGELRDEASSPDGEGLALAISAPFCLVDPSHEERAASILQRLLPRASITPSHIFGRMGLLERENAALLNAALTPLARSLLTGLERAVAEAGLHGPLFLTQNDATLMDLERASRFPVLTLSSGPTNSMRGAAWLTGLKDALVIDIGGTTTDVGLLQGGIPRESGTVIRLGGVRTHFRLPEVLSIGLGGGSVVTEEGGRVDVGPRSVGHRLEREALLFGGRTLTASDVAVALGRAAFGELARVAHLDAELLRRADATFHARLEDAIDRVKLARGDVPAVVVGGGSVLVGESLRGVHPLLRPEHAQIANAIGAAMAQVGGEVDQIFELSRLSRDEALHQARSTAIAHAVAAGAAPEGVEVVELEELPLAYLRGNAMRIRAKAVGELSRTGGEAHVAG